MLVWIYLPNIKILAINKIIHDTRSHGIFSVPEKYSAKHTGQIIDAFMNPNIENVNATWPTGGSRITFRNITCEKVRG